MKEIKFIAQSERVFEMEIPPRPSNHYVPKWFRETPKYNSIAGGTSSVVDFARNRGGQVKHHMTFKMCQPFIDSMSSGYIITLPATVVVSQVMQPDGSSRPKIDWSTSYDIADLQDPLVANNFPKPTGYSPDLFRWLNNWKVETPAGYSLLITHPVYRYDLPFHTLTGFVDTDKHINPIILPFFLKEKFEGEIEVGTPIAQIFPIKRETWESKKEMKIEKFGVDKVKQSFQKAYKNLWWTKKVYR